MSDLNFDYTIVDSANPIEWLETIANENKWPLEKISDEEATLECEGRWGVFTLSFLWQEEYQALQFCCTSDLKVPVEKIDAMKGLLFDVNHKTWMGHFDLEEHERWVVLRYTSLMRGFAMHGQEHVEDIIEASMTEFDRFYPAFKSVLSDRKVANDIMMTMLADAMGEA
jgi:hypothetical protein